MKAAYTGWTWITNREPEAAKNQLKQAFQECKFLGYDTVENFAFIRDYYADDPQALVDLTKECGVDLVNLYGHFTFDVEEAIRIAKEQIDFCAAVGVKWYWQSDIDYFAEHTNPDYVSFCFDTAHTTLAGMDPAALIRQYGSRVAYMHLKDVDTYALSKAEGRDKMGTFRALGHGTVNFPAVKAALEEVGFDGVLCVELDRPEVCNFHSAEVSRIYLRDVLGI